MYPQNILMVAELVKVYTNIAQKQNQGKYMSHKSKWWGKHKKSA